MPHLAPASVSNANPRWAPGMGLPNAGGATGWPDEDLQAFALRMASHGYSVSRTFMRFDRRYALEQLQLAHTSADDALRAMATRLFGLFLHEQSGIGTRG